MIENLVVIGFCVYLVGGLFGWLSGETRAPRTRLTDKEREAFRREMREGAK